MFWYIFLGKLTTTKLSYKAKTSWSMSYRLDKQSRVFNKNLLDKESFGFEIIYSNTIKSVIQL